MNLVPTSWFSVQVDGPEDFELTVNGIVPIW